MRALLNSIILIVSLVAAGCVLADADAADPSAPMRLVVLGDRTGGHVPGIYGEILDEVNLLRPDIIVTVGDQIEGYSEDTVLIPRMWAEYDSLVSRLTAPLYMTPGNHDIFCDVSESIFRGSRPHPYYSFDRDRVHFIILDNSRLDDPDGWPEDQVAWLKKDLQDHAAAVHTLVFYHKPFWFETLAAGKPDMLHGIFVQYGVDVVFTGHYHEYFSGYYDGIKYVGVGSSGAGTHPGPTGINYHFMWVTIGADDIDIAIIKKGTTKPWDDITASEKRLAQRVESNGLRMPRPFHIGPVSNPPDSLFTLEITNFSDRNIDDTLVWKIPEAWDVVPENLAVQLDSGQARSFVFRATRKGDVYPLPELSIVMPFAPEKKFTVNKPLRIARTAEAASADKVKIDGVLDESCWKYYEEEYYDWQGGPAKTDPVKFAFAYDKDNLYLSALCRESRPDSIVALVTERDGAIYGEDCVGYFIQPDPDTMLAYQIYFNPLGTCYDAKITIDDDGYADAETGWNGKYEVKTKRGDDFWSFEAKIPLKQFGTIAQKGKSMNLNFRRKQKRLDTAADWMDIDHHPETYGILMLK